MALINFLTLLAICVVTIAAIPTSRDVGGRIIGGANTTINKYPEMASVLLSTNGINFYHHCGGTIINNISILTAAHCIRTTNATHAANRLRFRLGSTNASSGGIIYNVASYIIHPSFNVYTLDNDIAILRSATTIVYSITIQPGNIASATYNLPDNQTVWTTGWGRQTQNGANSEQLREVQTWIINQNTCAQRYSIYGTNITPNMLCTGWLDVGGLGECQGDFGGPVFHNFVVVGISSFNRGCGLARYPNVSARVSRYTSWIQTNA